MSIRNITRIYISVLVLIFPFIFIQSVYSSSELPKFIAFCVGTVLLYILFLFQFIKTRKKIIWGWPFIVLGAFLLSLFVVDVFGLDVRTSLLGSEYRLQGFVLFLAGSMLFISIYGLISFDKDFKNTILKAVITSGVVLALFTVLDFTVHSNNALQYRTSLTLGNPNFLGGYLTMIFALVLFSKTKRRYAILLLFMVAILFTGSRSAFLGITVATIAAAFLLRDRVYVMSSIIIVCLFLLVSPRYSMWNNQAIIWQKGVNAVIARPLLGYGQENFELIFPKNLHTKVDNAHNILLELMVSSGIVGTGLFIWFFAILFKRASWNIRVFLVVFLITASFNPLSISQWFLFWVIAPFALSFKET